MRRYDRFPVHSILVVLLSFFSVGKALADSCTQPDPNAPWRLVFADEFNGDRLDRSRWSTAFPWGNSIIVNNEKQFYVNDGEFGYNPFEVSDGILKITADRTPRDPRKLYLVNRVYSATAGEIFWQRPEGSYQFEVRRDGQFLGRIDGQSWFDASLEEGRAYVYEVIAYSRAGAEITRSETALVAKNHAPEPGRTERYSMNLQYRGYAPNAVEVFWNPPARATRYRIYRDGEFRRELEGQGYRSFYEAGLRGDREYNYEVEAVDVCGEIIIEEVVRASTGGRSSALVGDNTTSSLELTHRVYSSTAGELFWQPVQGASRYEVRENGRVLRNGAGRSLFVGDLVPGKVRVFEVLAFDRTDSLVDGVEYPLQSEAVSYAIGRQDWVSGMITSHKSFNFRYGKAEMRARFPAGQGYWGAFWLLNTYFREDEPEDPEIDVMESLGHQTNKVNAAYHLFHDDDGDRIWDRRSRVFSQQMPDGGDFSKDFHTYTVIWRPWLIIYQLDGKEFARVEGPDVSTEQMYLIANLAVGGWYPGDPDSTTPYPASLEIDYIRVWQR